jgi:hypothetical protein
MAVNSFNHVNGMFDGGQNFIAIFGHSFYTSGQAVNERFA